MFNKSVIRKQPDPKVPPNNIPLAPAVVEPHPHPLPLTIQNIHPLPIEHLLNKRSKPLQEERAIFI